MWIIGVLVCCIALVLLWPHRIGISWREDRFRFFWRFFPIFVLYHHKRTVLFLFGKRLRRKSKSVEKESESKPKEKVVRPRSTHSAEQSTVQTEKKKQGSAKPSTDSDFVDDSLLPPEHSLLPPEHSLLHSERSLLPSEDKLLPSEDKLLPSEDKLLPSEDKLLPSEDKLLPSEDKLLPSEDKLLPSEDKLLPSEDKLLTSEEKLLPSEDKLLPSEDKLLPAEGKLLSSEDNLLLAEDTKKTRSTAEDSSQSERRATDESPKRKTVVDQIRSFYQRIVTVWAREKSFIRSHKRWLFKLLRFTFRLLRPISFRIHLSGGFADPSETGMLFGLTESMSSHSRSPKASFIRFTPHFPDAGPWNSHGAIFWRTSLGALLLWLLLTIVTYPWWELWKFYLRSRRRSAQKKSTVAD